MTKHSRFARQPFLLLAFSAGFYASYLATSPALGADAEMFTAPSTDTTSASLPVQAPARFFTINSVLAKIDRERGRGPYALRLAAVTPPSATVTDALPETAPAATPSEEPFGLFTFRAPDGILWQKWRTVEAEIARERTVLERCKADASSCPSHAAQFLRLVEAVRSKSGRAQLAEANQGVNTAVRYVSDLSQFGELDRWSAPLATFATAKGDCEDYVIAKYAALLTAGFPQADLKILLVRDRIARQDHAVLAARSDAHWLILDNRWADLHEDSASLRFTPLYAISNTGVHLFATPYAKARSLAQDADTRPASEANEGQQDSDVSSLLGAAALPL